MGHNVSPPPFLQLKEEPWGLEQMTWLVYKMHITKVEATSDGQAVILNSQTEPCVGKWWLQMVLVNHMFLFTTGILTLGCAFDLVVVATGWEFIDGSGYSRWPSGVDQTWLWNHIKVFERLNEWKREKAKGFNVVWSQGPTSIEVLHLYYEVLRVTMDPM